LRFLKVYTCSMTRLWRRIRSRTLLISSLLLSSVLLSACADPLTMVATSVLSAVIQTGIKAGIESAQNNRSDPEKLWQQAQLAQVEQQAIGGNVDAQFQLGIYYLLRQEPRSVGWICLAANQGHARAQLQYGHLYNEDRKRNDLFPFVSIAPDNVQAFVWYSLAAGNQDARAILFRDNMKQTGLNSQRLNQALAAIESWQPGPCGEPQTLTQQQPRASTPDN